MSNENKTQPETKSEGALPKPEPKPLAETMAHVVRAGGTELETNESKRPPGSDAKSSEPNRALILPAKSSQPLPSSQDARQAALLLSGIPELPTLLPEERYRVEGEFAKGGLGRILKAHDERLNRPVAMKEMLRRTGGNAEKRFLREALITAKLEHPGIIPVHDLGRWDAGGAYYTMKLVSGKSFDKVIAEKKTFEERLALLPHVIDACDAMAYAHEQGVIHRDLKPGNILLGSFGETVVIDWGIAKEMGVEHELKGADEASAEESEPYRESADISQEQLTKEGSVLGTPAYMPIEQARGAEVDARADVYALGSILYHVMCGKPPIVGKKSLEVLQKLFDGGPQPIEQREPQTPKELATIIKKAMAREASDRYASASGLVADLKAYQTGKLVGAHAYSMSELFWRWIKKNRVYLGASAASLMVIGALSVLHYFEVKEQRDHANRAKASAILARDEAEIAKSNEEKVRKSAQEQAEDLKLQAARDALEKDPAQTISWLKQLDPTKKQPNWSSVRTILADAISRGVPVVAEGKHAGEITSLHFSPDGSLLASTSVDHSVKLWDAKTKKLRATLNGHTDRINAGAFSPDGSLFASGGAEKDSTVRLWKTSTGEQSALFTGHTGNIRALAFSSDQKFLASAGTDGTIRLWDASGASAQAIELKAHTGEIKALSFSPDGTLASVGADGLVLLWDIQTKKHQVIAKYEVTELYHVAFSSSGAFLAWGGLDVAKYTSVAGLYSTKEKKTSPITPTGNGVGFVRFSADEESLALVLSDNKEFLLVSPKSCQPKNCAVEKLDAHSEATVQVLFTPDGQKMISGSTDQTIKIWSTKTKAAYKTLRGTNNTVKRLSLSPDGITLASASPDGLIRFWDLSVLEKSALVGHAGVVRDVAFSPDGSLLASASDDATVRVWRSADSALLHTFATQAPSFSVEFSVDGELVVASNNNNVSLWSATDGALVKTLSGPKDLITGIAVSRDGKYIAATSVDKAIHVWESASGKIAWTTTIEGLSANEITFSPDGSTLASLGFDRTVRFWDVASGKLSREFAVNGCAKLFYSPDATQLVTSGCAPSPQLWTLRGNSAPSADAIELTGHLGVVFSAAFSPNADRAVTAGYDDVARIFTLDSKESRALPSYGADVEAAVFSPDGKTIAIASDDAMIHLFTDDLPTAPDQLRAFMTSLQTTSK
jgi:WD40 repeat protein/tRNA A-37 threonylcarbamoyl transferase component Bud32